MDIEVPAERPSLLICCLPSPSDSSDNMIFGDLSYAVHVLIAEFIICIAVVPLACQALESGAHRLSGGLTITWDMTG